LIDQKDHQSQYLPRQDSETVKARAVKKKKTHETRGQSTSDNVEYFILKQLMKISAVNELYLNYIVKSREICKLNAHRCE